MFILCSLLWRFLVYACVINEHQPLTLNYLLTKKPSTLKDVFLYLDFYVNLKLFTLLFLLKKKRPASFKRFSRGIRLKTYKTFVLLVRCLIVFICVLVISYIILIIFFALLYFIVKDRFCYKVFGMLVMDAESITSYINRGIHETSPLRCSQIDSIYFAEYYEGVVHSTVY